jgi:hypothetical protein
MSKLDTWNDPIGEINALLESPPASIEFTREDIEEIICAKNLGNHIAHH